MIETKRDKIDIKLKEITELISDLKFRINPQYENSIGTESYERRQCVEALEFLLSELM